MANTLTRDLRNIIDAKVAAGETHVKGNVLESFAMVLLDFAESEADDDKQDDADKLTDASTLLGKLAERFKR